ncbi:hypothetical protein E5Q_03843 [Mixia osmundae IAM 14324]|uniref:Uncharacterized protein n=1 Tax=Mixia osmundae (strain CBS 9802 / IAM 14324 / JCM 22182 / KY 12970) TaxID=764103 RepID=G7E2Y6_MIXOS|nr:hypothetical protein E5Q_03843 [Mixia osmundae IAM 14324]
MDRDSSAKTSESGSSSPDRSPETSFITASHRPFSRSALRHGSVSQLGPILHLQQRMASPKPLRSPLPSPPPVKHPWDHLDTSESQRIHDCAAQLDKELSKVESEWTANRVDSAMLVRLKAFVRSAQDFVAIVPSALLDDEEDDAVDLTSPIARQMAHIALATASRPRVHSEIKRSASASKVPQAERVQTRRYVTRNTGISLLESCARLAPSPVPTPGGSPISPLSCGSSSVILPITEDVEQIRARLKDYLALISDLLADCKASGDAHAMDDAAALQPKIALVLAAWTDDQSPANRIATALRVLLAHRAELQACDNIAILIIAAQGQILCEAFNTTLRLRKATNWGHITTWWRIAADTHADGTD